MDLKQWRPLGLTLVALLAIYALLQVREASHSVKSSTFIDVAEEDIGRIVVVEGEQSADIVRLDTLWVLTGHETSELRGWRMDAIMNSVFGAKRESMISENPAKFGTYGVDSTGRELTVYDTKGDLRGHWIIGQSPNNYRSSYVRESGSNEVYMTDRSIYHFLGTTPDFWLEPPPPAPDTTAVDEE